MKCDRQYWDVIKIEAAKGARRLRFAGGGPLHHSAAMTGMSALRQFPPELLHRDTSPAAKRGFLSRTLENRSTVRTAVCSAEPGPRKITRRIGCGRSAPQSARLSEKPLRSGKKALAVKVCGRGCCVRKHPAEHHRTNVPAVCKTQAAGTLSGYRNS